MCSSFRCGSFRRSSLKFSLLQRVAAGLLLGWGGLALAAGERAEAPNFYLLEYAPGAGWDAGASFYEQPGIEKHRAYLDRLQEANILMLGGLTTGDSMSLVLIRADSEQEASALLMNDPAVSGGLLTGEVKGWRVYQSSMRHVGTSPQDERKAEPYRLERLDPAAPISLKENP